MQHERDPLLDLLGFTFAKVSADKGKTRLSFRVGDTEAAELDVASRAQLVGDTGPVASGSRAFVRQLKRLRGQPVSDVQYTAGQSIVVSFGKEAVLTISLRGGDFEGDVAARLQVGDGDLVDYHHDGMTRAGLRRAK